MTDSPFTKRSASFKMRNTLLFLSFIFLFSCTDAEKIIYPPDVLSQQQMAAMMKDLCLLEATMNVHAASVDPASKANASLKMDLYARNGITREQFERSYKFYTENPEAMNEVYQLVLNDLSTLQATVKNQK